MGIYTDLSGTLATVIFVGNGVEQCLLQDYFWKREFFGI